MRERGFTLLEIMVAMAVLALGAVSLLELFTGSRWLQTRAAVESRVVLRARALMDELLWRAELTDGTEEGVTPEGFHWRRTVAHADPALTGEEEDELGEEADYSLRTLEVEVTWRDGHRERSYVLHSLRVAPESE